MGSTGLLHVERHAPVSAIRVSAPADESRTGRRRGGKRDDRAAGIAPRAGRAALDPGGITWDGAPAPAPQRHSERDLDLQRRRAGLVGVHGDRAVRAVWIA